MYFNNHAVLILYSLQVLLQFNFAYIFKTICKFAETHYCYETVWNEKGLFSRRAIDDKTIVL